MRFSSILVVCPAVVGATAPALPDAYGFVQQFNVSGVVHQQKVYLDKPNQFERLDGNAGPNTIQLNRPKAQGCTYSVNGVGTSWVGCSDWAATSVVGDPIHPDEMAACGSDTIDGVVCDKFCGQGGYSCTAWFKKGTNELVQTQSADDEKAGTDKGLKKFSSWMSTLPAGTFDVDPAWKCQGPAQCSATPAVATAASLRNKTSAVPCAHPMEACNQDPKYPPACCNNLCKCSTGAIGSVCCNGPEDVGKVYTDEEFAAFHHR